MARTISDEDIKLNIIINGNPVQKQLLDLEKSTRKLTKETDALKIERKKLEVADKKGGAEWKKLNATIKANTETLDNNKATMKELQNQIGITGLTMSQLKKKAMLLRMQLQHVIPNGENEKRYNKELKAVEKRLNQLKLKGKQTKLSLSSVANGFNKYAALGASAVAATTGVVLGIQKMIDYNGKLSDAQADVQKTTGLTKKEVDELTKSFGVFNTRTSRMDLLKIAEEGGRIGIAKEEITDFVRVMNKANVALGDSFEGGPKEVASKLGKLKLLFKETKNIGVEKAYESIGSAINELGANGVATETNIANFATRIGSLPDNLKPSIQDALGLGAAFEESGVQAEISGRAYALFLGAASTKTEKFAKVMGISTQEVENLIDTNPTEFFLQFSDKLAKTSKGGVDTARTLKDLGLSADGVKKIVGAAGNNIDRFRGVLDLSNTAMIEGTSLTKEYDIKNNNLAATIDKVKKKLIGAFSSEFIIGGLSRFIVGIGKLVGAVKDVNQQIDIQNAATFKSAQNNRKLADESKVLLGRYQTLTKDGLIPTKKQKKELDTITLHLKDRLGESVISIDKETGSYKLNTEAVKEQIKLKALMADEEAVTLISRRLRVKEEIENLQSKLKLAEKEKNLRLDFFEKEANFQNGLKGRGEAIKAVKAESDLRNQLNIQLERQVTIAQQLKDLNVSETQADKLFKEANTPKEGEVKFVGNTKFVFTGGDWVAQKPKKATGGNGGSGDEDTDETTNKQKYTETDLTAFIQAQRAKRSLDAKTGIEKDLLLIDEKYNKEIAKAEENHLSTIALEEEKEAEKQALKLQRQQDFKDKLAEIEANDKLTAEEKEIEKVELDFEKHEEDLLLLQLNKEEETALLLRLQEAEKAQLAAIDTKYRKKELKAAETTRKQKLALQNKILNSAVQLAGRETKVGQALLAIKGVLAAKESLIQLGVLKTKAATATAGAKISIAEGWSKTLAAGFPQNIPLIIGFAAQVAGIISSIKAATSATKAPGFEDGLYKKEMFPIQREQDGKIFNASFGGETKSGIVSKPTVFMAGENGPELIVDSKALKQINPDIRNSFQREIARVKGFEAGYYPQQKTTDVSSEDTNVPLEDTNSANTEMIAALNRASAIFEKLEKHGITAYMSNDLRTAKQIQKNIEDYNALRNKNRK